MFQRLLFCTDFSDGVHRLTHFVPSFVSAGIEQVIFLHTVPLDGGNIPRVDQVKVDQARQRLEAALQAVPPEIDVRVEVESGRPSEAIVRVAKHYQVDLIVLGMPTRSTLGEKLFGSTTLAVCQRSTVPLMVLRPQLISTYTSEELDLRCRHLFRCLLIPYDGTDSARYLVSEIKKHAQDRPDGSLQHCHLCWVVEDVGRRGVPSEYYVEPAQKALIAVKAELETLHLSVDAEVRQGEPIVEVLDVAQMVDVSAIATTSSSLGKFQELSIPSFTRELLNRSWHPVIYFPPQR
jgi:nucleotide-binding universal stress UspA family protein